MSDSSAAPTVVVGAAIIRNGRVLAARRVLPADVAGGWELPGGKVEPEESLAEAAVREVREELGCEIAVTGILAGETEAKPGYVLRVAVAALVSGEPVPHEHDVVRWLAPEELDAVRWLDADRPYLPELRSVLLDGAPLEGGNVGGAVRIGHTVRRATGPWTPAVHALLAHLDGFPCVPRVLGVDERGQEVLSYLPGHVVDVDTEVLTVAQLVSLVGWTRAFHDAVAGFEHKGPWRFFGADEQSTLVAHNDLATYNICFEGDRLVGVFDWDLSGPTTPLLELAFIAWNCVPLTRDVGAALSARRLELIASAYGGPTALEVLRAVPHRIQAMLDGIPRLAANGDTGMRNLMRVGEPARSQRTLAGLVRRIPDIERELR